MVDTSQNQLSFSQKPPVLYKQDKSDDFNLDKAHFEKENYDHNDL